MQKPKMKPKIFGTGLVAMDVVMNADPQSPIRSWAGGTCGNVLSILAYLGWDAYPIARMNGDPASQRVRADLKHWGVHLDFASCSPTTHTPIIVEEIRKNRHGMPTHKFSWSCPHCGEWLPGFKAVTIDAVEVVAPHLPGASVFFLDRLSRAALMLAELAVKEGAVVVFEPSGKSDPKMFAEALKIAHVVKYSDQRLSEAGGAMQSGNATLLEVQTMGDRGLRYRHALGRKPSDWISLSSITAPRLSDTCGSGDWCTAGLIASSFSGGIESFRASGAGKIRESLRYGQALAAWNCGFEGARGGMYAFDRSTVERVVSSLLTGKLSAPLPEARQIKTAALACPACPAESGKQGPKRSGSAKKRAA